MNPILRGCSFDLTCRIMAYEQGECTNLEVLELFQRLVDTGMAWQLQGSYGRTASRLLEDGAIQPPDSKRFDHVG